MNMSRNHNIIAIFYGLRRWRFYRLATVLSLLATVLLLGISAAKASATEVIYSFAGDADGEYADTDLAIDGVGNLYGSTVLGGDFGSCTVWQLAPSGNSWTHTVLYSFPSGPDGGEPYKGVTLDAEGNLYGTATTGGAFGSGTVFELSPTQVGEWDFKTLYSFRGQPDGVFPYGALLFDRSGNIFGTTYYGGVNGIGAVYQLAPRPTGEWQERVLYSFASGGDGNSPISHLNFDSFGNRYGTTREGGLGRVTLFKLTRVRDGR